MATIFVSTTGSNTSPFDTEAKAATTLGGALAIATASDVIKISSAHAESTAGAISYTFPATMGLQILSVVFDGAGTGALTAGASITNSSNGTAFNLVSGFAYVFGVSFIGAAGSSNSNAINVASATAQSGMFFESCVFNVQGTGVTARLMLGPAASNNDCYMKFTNCTFSYGADKSYVLRNGNILMENLTLAGTAPTTVFLMSTLDTSEFDLVASDLSNLAWTNLVSVSSAAMTGYFRAVGCKLRAGFTPVTGTFVGPGGPYVDLIDCNSGDVNYYFRREQYEGLITADNNVYADATDGFAPISWKVETSANVNFYNTLDLPTISFFNQSLSAMTTVVECINDGTTFKDNELWQETHAKVTSGSPLKTINRGDRAANILSAGSNQATSTKTWTGAGGFGAAVKQKLESTSFTPAETGTIEVVVKVAKPSATVYVSPKILTTSARQFTTALGGYVNESINPAHASGSA